MGWTRTSASRAAQPPLARAKGSDCRPEPTKIFWKQGGQRGMAGGSVGRARQRRAGATAGRAAAALLLLPASHQEVEERLEERGAAARLEVAVPLEVGDGGGIAVGSGLKVAASRGGGGGAAVSPGEHMSCRRDWLLLTHRAPIAAARGLTGWAAAAAARGLGRLCSAAGPASFGFEAASRRWKYAEQTEAGSAWTAVFAGRSRPRQRRQHEAVAGGPRMRSERDPLCAHTPGASSCCVCASLSWCQLGRCTQDAGRAHAETCTRGARPPATCLLPIGTRLKISGAPEANLCIRMLPRCSGQQTGPVNRGE